MSSSTMGGKRNDEKIDNFITCIAMCLCLVMPVSAAEQPPIDGNIANYETNNVQSMTAGSSYFSKITPLLNSLTGRTATATLSSGSCIGNNESITNTTVYCRVSNGSSPYTLTVVAPSGTSQSISCGTSSTTYTFTGFNGEDPNGTWTIYVTTRGTVTTVTATLKVYYTYS